MMWLCLSTDYHTLLFPANGAVWFRRTIDRSLLVAFSVSILIPFIIDSEDVEQRSSDTGMGLNSVLARFLSMPCFHFRLIQLTASIARWLIENGIMHPTNEVLYNTARNKKLIWSANQNARKLKFESSSCPWFRFRPCDLTHFLPPPTITFSCASSDCMTFRHWTTLKF